MFGYRHAVKLRLKVIVGDVRRLLRDRIAGPFAFPDAVTSVIKQAIEERADYEAAMKRFGG